MRERFFGVVARARTALDWAADRVLTQVVDRCIFGDEVFERIVTDPYLRLITWEKGLVAVPWDPALVSGRTVITRCQNSSTDLRSYHFEYFERPWAKNPELRQIVVLATHPHGRRIQVAILTDDCKRAHRDLSKELLAEELAAVAHTARLKTRQELRAQESALPEGDRPERAALQRKLKIIQRADER